MTITSVLSPWVAILKMSWAKMRILFKKEVPFPDEPNYCLALAYDVEVDVQQITLVINGLAGMSRPHRLF